MISMATVKEESVANRTDRLTESTGFWMRRAREALDDGNVDGTIEHLRSAMESCLTLRAHLRGGPLELLP